MIFVTDAQGRSTFVSSDWTEFTGQSLGDAVSFGWAKVVHPDDREATRKVVADAIQAQCAFSVRFRLLASDGGARWVAAGAVPSFGPPDRTFLGFLGSITQIADAFTPDLRAYGSLGSFVPPPPYPGAQSASALEQIADHLLAAHATVAHAAADQLRVPIESALHAVGLELARAEREGRILPFRR